MPDRAKVARYCRQQPRVGRHLPEFAERVRECFGPRVGLELIVYQDPEIDDRYLSMHVKTPFEPGLIDRIERINSEFHDHWESDDGHLILSPYFVRQAQLE
jgi:hypothetical protein